MRAKRPEHKPQGDPCGLCGLRYEEHRTREYRYRPGRKEADRNRHRTDLQRTTFIGIDGEGQGRTNHRYVLLAASTEKGDRDWTVCAANPEKAGLTTVECLDLILELPTRRSKIFSYAFNYDITKMLTDLPDRTLYRLMRPDIPSRRGKYGPKPLFWCPQGCNVIDSRKAHGCVCDGGPYSLNLQGTKFTVGRAGKRVVIWDLIKFFQSKFVGALEAWKVGDPALWKRMTAMKDKRADFDKESKQAVESYCLEECRCMAQLARKLIESHESAGLKLRTYYGAGSSGAAMLTAMGIRDKLTPTPEVMREAVAAAFSGGRFENSVIGEIREPLQGWDISSAYVYQLAFLPCLQHGSWTHTTKRNDIEKAEAQSGALIRYGLGPNSRITPKGRAEHTSWGPFPFRDEKGTISYPIESGGGWVWLDEFLAGERIFPNVFFREAWVYTSHCNCRPFGQIPEYYNLRLKIGKEGPGIVIKLGMNSCYGKLAQSVGNALFNSWIWAGMITSGCRAQILQMMGLHKDMSNMLMVATDGIMTREKLTPPIPIETGTGATGKPLGGWERKDSDKGVFLARPGIYFPLEPTPEEITSIRARGVGRGVVLESWRAIVDSWRKDGIAGTAKVANVARFCGAKTSISASVGGTVYKRADGTPKRLNAEGRNVAPAYGQWVEREVALTFNPKPKRERLNPDGLTLELRRYPSNKESQPYRRAMISEEAKQLMAAVQEMMEQPDMDLSDYAPEEGT